MRNAREMKAANRLRVLRLLRRGPSSRSDLAASTGLTRAAMSLIIGELIEQGLVSEAGRRDSRSGRRPVLVELRPDYAYSLALTIARSRAEAGVADFTGRLVSRVPIDLEGVKLNAALARIRKTLTQLTAAPRRWLGLGISTPGPVDTSSGTILNPPHFDLWHNVRLCGALGGIGIEHCFLENNAQALTTAEKAFGIGRDCANFVLLVVEAGVGGGIVRGDEIYAGWRGFGNEIGHTSVDLYGPNCSCGLRGCVELYSAVPNVLAAARKQRRHISNWYEFIDLAEHGDTVCGALLTRQAEALGTALVNVLNVLELDAVVLTGDILYHGEMLRSKIERFIAEHAINRGLRQVRVSLSPLGERPELMAAASIVGEKYFAGQFDPFAVRPPSN